MTRLVSTLWASTAAGLVLTGTAFAQTAPADPQTDPITTTPPPPPVVDDNDVTGRTVADPVDVDVEVTTPPPARSTDYVVVPTTTYDDDDDDDEWEPASGLGIALAAGGGASGFTHDAARLSTNPGGDWDLRLTLGTNSPLAFEGSYIGSAQSINALGLDNDAMLVGNGVQGALRVNATLDAPVQPFLFAGAAWRHYELENVDTNNSDVNQDDNVLEIPMGLGLAGRYRGLMLDARGEFRASTNEDLIPERGEQDDIELDEDNFAAMHRWGVKATVGFEF